MIQTPPSFTKQQSSKYPESGEASPVFICLMIYLRSYMMYHKAILFKDPTVALTILKAHHPREVKNLGRKVKNFNQDTWVKHREDIVTKGTLLKFTKPVNDEGLKEKLLATGDQDIVEASPYDRIWGIGFTEKHADDVRDDWGLNLLGKAIMVVRTQLREEDAKA